MEEFYKLSIKEKLKGLTESTFSSLELTQSYLQRIKKIDKKINSFITVLEDKAIESARESDRRYKEGSALPLDGIPIAHKDIFCTEGVLTTCGSKMLSNFISPYSSTVVENFLANGSIILGKTNMDEFAMGSSNETSYFGAVNNPWKRNYVPGGSSGGSAACVSAGLASGATATDTGGSIRQPAAFCGVIGLKPTYGLISRHGLIAYASSFDQIGPIAKSTDDILAVMNVISGKDDFDSTVSRKRVEKYSQLIFDQKPKKWFPPDRKWESQPCRHAASCCLGVTMVPCCFVGGKHFVARYRCPTVMTPLRFSSLSSSLGLHRSSISLLLILSLIHI